MERQHETATPTQVNSVGKATQANSAVKDVYPNDRLEEYAAITRSLISEENARINERTTWLLQLHGFLFAGLAFAWEAKDPFVIILLSAVGILSSLAIGNSLRWATRAMDSIQDEWNYKQSTYKGPRIIGTSQESGGLIERQLLLHPPYMLTSILTVVWLVALVYRVAIHY